MQEETDRIVVVGTSAGGLTALNELVAQFDPTWDAAFFIVLHLSRKSISGFLLQRLQQHTSLPCKMVEDNMQIERGHIYIAVPNFHLIVKKGEIKLGYGPEENRWKPSIDVLFRSAAVAYDGNVIGIVLTGMLDDGTSGMWAVKQGGGTTIVQDPNEAEYPDMPVAVLNKMEVDYCISLSEMGAVLAKEMKMKVTHKTAIPPELVAEAELAEKMASGIERTTALGKLTVFTCPDCGGILTEVAHDANNRLRCHTGHAYSQDDLLIKLADNSEATLWVALRMFEERRNLLKKMEDQARQRGFARYANEHKEKAFGLEKHVTKLKELLTIVQKSDVA